MAQGPNVFFAFKSFDIGAMETAGESTRKKHKYSHIDFLT